jgi:hypothetical protein
MQVVERLHEVLGASPPARQLGDQDGVDLTGLGVDFRGAENSSAILFTAETDWLGALSAGLLL